MIWVFCPCQWWVSKKKCWDGGWVEWGLSKFFWIFWIFLTLQSPLDSFDISIASWVKPICGCGKVHCSLRGTINTKILTQKLQSKPWTYLLLCIGQLRRSHRVYQHPDFHVYQHVTSFSHTCSMGTVCWISTSKACVLWFPLRIWTNIGTTQEQGNYHVLFWELKVLE